MILVTGGAGYIGSHTVRELRKSGFEPLIFDNFSTGHRAFVGDTPCVEGDIRNPEDLTVAFSRYPIEGVMHFAGKALVGESHVEPELYFEVNVTGGCNLLEAMNRTGVKRFIFSSTCATYGEPATVPIGEDTPQQPISPYGETKLKFEQALKHAHYTDGLEYLSLRYFNAAGADADGGIGEDHAVETHLIPLIFDAALGRRKDIAILGTDYPTPDGTCIRDYIHVTDLAKAHVMGMQSLITGGIQSQALNLGTGKGCSVREVIEMAKKITKKAFPVRETSRREGDPPMLVAAVDRAKEVLGWTAATSDLDQIIASAWTWHCHHFQNHE
jgi:UDP-glucose 4-epimerase